MPHIPKSQAEANALIGENIQKVLADGPRLRSDYNTLVLARNEAGDAVLLGGLGGMGVGQMWTSYSDYMGDISEVPVQEEPPDLGFGIVLNV